MEETHWRSYYEYYVLRFPTNLSIIPVFKVLISLKTKTKKKPFITPETPMVLVDKHDVAYVSLCFRKDTHISNKLYSAPFALLLDCVKPPRSADDRFYVTSK